MRTKQRDAFAPDQVDWILNNWHLVGIGLIVLGIAAFAGAREIERSRKEAARRESSIEAAAAAKARESQELRRVELRSAFAVGPLPPTPKLGTPPALPPIPAVDVLPNGQRSVDARIRYLVQQNPIEEIRTEMNGLIADGTLLLDQGVENGLFASFSYVPLNRIRVSGMSFPPGTAAVPVFSMDPTAVDKISSTTDALRAMIVVYHEFQHYRQWRSSPKEVRLYFIPKLVGSASTPDQCRVLWESELDAYGKECAQALTWGITDSAGDLCLRSEDPVDFRRTLFVMIGNGPQGQHMPECSSTWALLAGHPHPEAYK